MADAVANLTTTRALRVKVDMTILVCGKWVVIPSEEEPKQEINTVSVYEVEKENWHQPLIDYLNHGCQMMLGIRRKSKDEHHVFFTIMTLYIKAPSLACG